MIFPLDDGTIYIPDKQSINAIVIIGQNITFTKFFITNRTMPGVGLIYRRICES
jgi:hypothetical protein